MTDRGRIVRSGTQDDGNFGAALVFGFLFLAAALFCGWMLFHLEFLAALVHRRFS